jgi:hypothetical protein
MPIFRKDGKNILFIHVPKCGGSTIENAFRGSGYDVMYLDRDTKRTGMNHLRRCSPQHMHAQLLQEIFRLERFDLVFMTVRHPVARFRSEYVFRNKAQPTVALSAEDVSAWAATKFEKYSRNPYILDNHLRPQHEFWVPSATVYRLEDGLPALFADLNARFDLDVSQAPRALHSEKAVGFSSSAVELSGDLKAHLADFYAGDFDRFGYELDRIPTPPAESEPDTSAGAATPGVDEKSPSAAKKATARVKRKARSIARRLKP